jgi:hypothetical protein
MKIQHWKLVSGAWVLFYLVSGIYFYVTDIDKSQIYNSVFYLAVFIYFARKEIKFPAFAIFLFGLSIFFNTLGNFPFDFGNETRILFSFEYYDILIHFFGFFLFTIGILIAYHSKYLRLDLIIFLSIVLALLGIGAIIEIFEYSGFVLFGFGSGWLMFGEGDNSSNFGPWGDTSTDMIANLMGILLGFAVYYVVIYFKNANKHVIKNKYQKK